MEITLTVPDKLKNEIVAIAQKRGFPTAKEWFASLLRQQLKEYRRGEALKNIQAQVDSQVETDTWDMR